MKQLLLINPSTRQTIFGRMKTLALPPMGLGVLASHTPAEWEITVVDENLDELDFNIDADLVAVTATTVQAPRAYEIMKRFRSRGISTVLGGIHASVLPDEAACYADSVVQGEADDIWAGVLEDFEDGALKPFYRADAFPSLERMPLVDRGIYSDKYMIQSVQTSRGCPCDCSFCSVTQFNGKRYRFRSVSDVLKEVEQIKDNRFFIADDSVVGLGQRGIEHAHRLFQGLKGLHKSWGSQVCVTIAEHEDLLKAASAAGANTFYIGFESVESSALESMDKRINLRPKIRDFKEAINKMHDHGIGVIGGFILGTDTDTKDIFKRTAEFIHEAGVDGCQFTILTPFPGTRLFEQMRAEGRLLYTNFPEDWARYNAYELVIRPRNMTIHELVRGQQYMYDATSNLSQSFKRGVKTLVNTRSLLNAAINFSWNYYNYKAIKEA
ncbi:MAG: B12-binding domain-containing radical SAM protein [Proteobacteria bacterium]|nr:B12-binding domain-containing radical SAM protein [Pseudomonadota bacterium]